MAQHKSAAKSHRQSIKRRLRNQATISRIKTFTRKLKQKIVDNDIQGSKSQLRNVESMMRKAVNKNVLKLNTCSRKVSRLYKKIKLLEKDK